MKHIWKPVVAIVAVAAILFSASTLLAPIAQSNAEADLQEMMCHMLPGSTTFTPEEYTGEDSNITAVYKGETGYVIQTTVYGYAGNIVMMTAVDNEGAVTGLMVQEMEETFGLGDNAMVDYTFLMQYLHTPGENAVGENIDAITGATVTSNAVTKSVNSASAFVTGADVSSSASEWGEW